MLTVFYSLYFNICCCCNLCYILYYIRNYKNLLYYILDDEEYFLGEDNSNPMTTATQTMDLLALSVPPEKLIPPLLQLLEPALQGQDPLPRRAAYLSMAVIAEGCSEAICNKYLETMLNIVKVGITDPIPLVRNAAFFALGQFSEHLQPDITKFAPQILPILFEFLHQLCNELRVS